MQRCESKKCNSSADLLRVGTFLFARPSGFVDWKGLLRPLAADIDLDVDKEKDLLSVAQFYRNKKGYHTPISQAIVDAFSKDVNTNDNVRIVTHLPIFTYWTTNYDKLIEKGLEEANRNPDVKSEQDQLSVMNGKVMYIKISRLRNFIIHPSKSFDS